MFKLSIKSQISAVIATLIMLSFFIVKTLVTFGILEYSNGIGWYEYLSVILFMPPFFIIIHEVIQNQRNATISQKSMEEVLNESCLVSKTDAKGRIIDVNEKFCEVSGYKPQELLGQDHKLLNSGKHPKQMWIDMYRTTVKYKSIWYDVVTNHNKKGEEYVVKSWILANFDDKGKLTGFTSIRQDVTELVRTLEQVENKSKEVSKQNTYLEHAAKILRHDMHSGINTYMPRGLSSLKRRLTDDDIKSMKLEAPFKMLEEGLKHSQRVYAGVKEFTNLVKQDAVLDKQQHNLKEILDEYLSSTAYKNQVTIDELPSLNVNQPLFCTAIDNLIRNGLKYNDSGTKHIHIFMENESTLVVKDNGRGLTKEEFMHLSQPYTRKEGQKEAGTGLGLNICVSILEEHGFTIDCEKLEVGTKLSIKVL